MNIAMPVRLPCPGSRPMVRCRSMPVLAVHALAALCSAARPGAAGLHAAGSQRGQAAAEALLVLPLLAALWVGTAWLLRWQDIAMQAQHASRYAAFAVTRDAAARLPEEIRHGYFSGPAHLWRDRRGASLLSAGGSEVSVQLDRGHVLDAAAQPGGAHGDSRDLRQGWLIEDAGMVAARVEVAAIAPARVPQASGLAQFDAWRPRVRRHAAILAGAGHASSDAQAQQRVAGSGLGWAFAADRAYAQGRNVQSRAGGLDRPWGRAEPLFDWLGPWAGRVPDQHLRHAAARHMQDASGANHADD